MGERGSGGLWQIDSDRTLDGESDGAVNAATDEGPPHAEAATRSPRRQLAAAVGNRNSGVRRRGRRRVST